MRQIYPIEQIGSQSEPAGVAGGVLVTKAFERWAVDPITVSVIGISISAASFLLSAMAFRYARAKHLAAYPYIEARRMEANHPDHIDWSIVGPERQDWEVVKIKRLGGARLAGVDYETDGLGGRQAKDADPAKLARALTMPARCIIAIPDDSPVKLAFYLRSKANSAMKSRRVVRVNPLRSAGQ